MVHGLEVAAVGLGKLDGQSAFRIASARSQLGVDECPDETNVLAYSQVLLAEAETLALAVSSSASSGGGSGNANTNPKVKAMTTTSPIKPPGKPGGGGVPPAGQPSVVKLCKYWGSEHGCRQGRNCSYDHPQLPDFKNRCWNCSATSHQKADCPHRQGQGGQKGGGESKPPTTRKAAVKEGRGDAKSEAAPPSAKAMSGPSEQNEAGSTGGKQEEAEGQGGTSSGPAPSQATPPSPATGETLMNEVTGLSEAFESKQVRL